MPGFGLPRASLAPTYEAGYLPLVVAIIAAALVDAAGIFITKQFGGHGSAADPITIGFAAIVLVSIIGYGLLKDR